MDHFAAISMPLTMPTRQSIEPTDRSMLPVMIHGRHQGLMPSGEVAKNVVRVARGEEGGGGERQ
jgi:hypothetical protein